MDNDDSYGAKDEIVIYYSQQIPQEQLQQKYKNLKKHSIQIWQAKDERGGGREIGVVEIANDNHNNFHLNLTQNSYMYSYVNPAAITATAAQQAVHSTSLAFSDTSASASASSSSISASASLHDKLKLISTNNSNTITGFTLDESLINRTFIWTTSQSAIANDSLFAGLNLSSSIFLDSGVTNVTNTTSLEEWSQFYDLILSWQGICLISFFCIFIVITIIGNTLVILAVITTRRLKTVTNCFVMSLAVADLLVGIFVMPPAVAVHLIGSWQLGWVLCDIWISLDVLLCTASILSLCAISVDRYLAVTQPLTYSRKRRSKRLALLMILIVWILALAITCPPILGWYEPGRRDLKECRYNQNEGYVIFSAMGSFFIPMAVMIYVYARISCVIASRHDNMTDISVHNKIDVFLSSCSLLLQKFKRYTSADVDNELDHDLSDLDLSAGQKHKQKAARTLSNQTLAKELHEIMLSDNENGMVTQSHSLLALHPPPQAQAQNTQVHEQSADTRNGCYELTRPSSFKRVPSTASSNITTLTSVGTTAGTTASTQLENPWSFSAASTTANLQTQHPNKFMRTHSFRQQPYPHKHHLSAPPTTSTLVIPLSPTTSIATDTLANVNCGSGVTAAGGSTSSILRPHPIHHPHPPSAPPQLRAHHHHHHHHAAQLYQSKSLSNRITSLKKENKTTQTLSIVVGGFIACWLPFFINYLITPFLAEHQASRTLANVLTWLGWFNSAINPFIYAFYSVDFRAAFWRLTCKRCFSASTKPQFAANTMSIRR